MGDVLSLEPAATMYVLLNGLMNSLPYLPTALPSGLRLKEKSRTRVTWSECVPPRAAKREQSLKWSLTSPAACIKA